MKYTDLSKKSLVEKLLSDNGPRVDRRTIEAAAQAMGLPFPRFIIDNNNLKVGRGIWDLGNFDPAVPAPVASYEQLAAPALAASVTAIETVRQKRLMNEFVDLVPEEDANFVSHGFFRDLTQIIRSKDFFPVFITGLSGNGKTSMVEQVCARLKREMFRVNISIETDEDDLIGGATLVDGNVVYREGPVLTAMRRGAVLLLDEVDRGSNKLLCLQSVLEGKSYLNKKTGEVVRPAPGFTVVATANTKGRGTEDGKYIAAQILDEAFLERFSITVEQEYAEPKVEKKIVMNYMAKYNISDEDFASKLVAWADIIRRTHSEGGVDEIISTRRLVDVVKTFSKFNDRKKAIELCTNRFDEETKLAFRELYAKLEAPPVPEEVAPAAPSVDPSVEIPF
jgi:MoxR-like ATPase